MPLNHNNIYEPSEEFKTNLKKWISKYLCSRTDGCTKQEYKKIFKLLSGIENSFYQQDYVSNDDPNLTFEQKRDMKAKEMKQYAFSIIITQLRKLREKRNKHNSDKENQGWIKCETKQDEIVKMIWKIWCHEREHCPRAGIILLYYDKLGSVEVLLTKYYKNNYIQYGYPKGKIEFDENLWNCAARESAEEIRLDAKIIYDQIQHSSPIKKNVFNAIDKSSIEHFYFIIPVNTKNIELTPNEKEIHGVEWHSVYQLPCCNNCQIKKSMQSTDNSREPNYFMVTCTDLYERNSLVRNILMYMDKMNDNQTTSQKYDNIHRLCRHNYLPNSKTFSE